MNALATLDIDAALPDGPREGPLADPQADRARLDAQLAKLDRLADLGLQIAEGLAAQAKGTGPKVVEGDLALAYDRVARAVRMAVMLQSRLVQDLRAPQQAVAVPGAAPADAAVARKDRVARIVKRIAQADRRLEGYQVSWAAREARERLEHDDIYGPVMSQPISELIADICDDIGLTPDWKRLAVEAWAQDEIDSGMIGEPLQDLLDAASPACGREGPRSGGEGADEANPCPVSIPTLEDQLQALARDPQVLAAAGRSLRSG